MLRKKYRKNIDVNDATQMESIQDDVVITKSLQREMTLEKLTQERNRHELCEKVNIEKESKFL